MSIKGYYDKENCNKFESKFKVKDIKDVIKYLRTIENQLKGNNIKCVEFCAIIEFVQN